MQKYFITVDDHGDTRWYSDNHFKILHRTDGPAVESEDGCKIWLINDKLHRTDGPAFVAADGDKLWYLNGKQMTEEEHTLRTAPAHEMTVAQIEAALGYKFKAVK